MTERYFKSADDSSVDESQMDEEGSPKNKESLHSNYYTQYEAESFLSRFSKS